MMLPQDVLAKYDNVVKSLIPPVFDMYKHAPDAKFEVVFDEAVYKMAQYYFAVFQTLFTKESSEQKMVMSTFLAIKDPLYRSRKLIGHYEEMHGIIERKMFYLHKTAEEFKERSKV